MRKLVPITRTGVALWGWRHRNEIGGWLGYAIRSAPRLVAGDSADVLLEGRVRSRLTADRRTRDREGIGVAVENGVVTLSGRVDADLRDAAVEIATSTGGVRRVVDRFEHGRRRWARR
jgi:osmotically-inducible protein OsmY